MLTIIGVDMCCMMYLGCTYDVNGSAPMSYPKFYKFLRGIYKKPRCARCIYS